MSLKSRRRLMLSIPRNEPKEPEIVDQSKSFELSPDNFVIPEGYELPSEYKLNKPREYDTGTDLWKAD